MVKITIRDLNDFKITGINRQFKACCINTNGEILALGRDDIFHSIGTIDTTKHTIILSDGQCFENAVLSVDQKVPTGRV